MAVYELGRPLGADWRPPRAGSHTRPPLPVSAVSSPPIPEMARAGAAPQRRRSAIESAPLHTPAELEAGRAKSAAVARRKAAAYTPDPVRCAEALRSSQARRTARLQAARRRWLARWRWHRAAAAAIDATLARPGRGLSTATLLARRVLLPAVRKAAERCGDHALRRARLCTRLLRAAAGVTHAR